MTNIADDDPLTLAEACKLFPRAKFTVSTLRAESERKRLEIFRLGRRDYTTLGSMREMVRRSREENHRRGETSTVQAINGSSTAAQAALMSKLQRLTSGNQDGDGRKPS